MTAWHLELVTPKADTKVLVLHTVSILNEKSVQYGIGYYEPPKSDLDQGKWCCGVTHKKIDVKYWQELPNMPINVESPAGIIFPVRELLECSTSQNRQWIDTSLQTTLYCWLLVPEELRERQIRLNRWTCWLGYTKYPLLNKEGEFVGFKYSPVNPLSVLWDKIKKLCRIKSRLETDL